MPLQRETDMRWHMGKEIPLALIFAMFVQTGGWIWWAATQTAETKSQSEKLNTLTTMMTEFRVAQYTQADARRDQDAQRLRSESNTRRIEAIESRQIPPKTRYLKDYR